MKKVAFGIACGLFAIFTLVVMLTLYGRQARQEETNAALSQAVHSALSGVMSADHRGIKEDKEFTADFLKAFLVQANSDSDIRVTVLDADVRLGLLSVEITEKFQHPNGKDGSVSNVRTVIFDREQEKETERKTVSFYCSDELYKEYEIPEHSVCAFPVPPQKKGKKFRCWRFVTGGVGAASEMRVSGAKGTRNILASGGVPYRVAEDTKLIAVFDEKQEE